MAKEFSKEKITEDYEYMISAIFSERAVRKGLAGVFYPSVRAEGIGYNIALEPNSSDANLMLVAVAECTIYKKNKNIIVDNETYCIINDDKLPIELKPVEARYHMGRDVVYSKLNSSL